MLQADVGNPRLVPVGAVPRPGYRFRDFRLRNTSGDEVNLSDFRGRANLVIVFAGVHPVEFSLVQDLANSCDDLQALDARLLIILTDSRDGARVTDEQIHSGAVILIDDFGDLHRSVGAVDSTGQPSPAVYITDRFAEIITGWSTAEGGVLPNRAEILDWLNYVESVCPECEAPEWPVD